MRFYIGQDALDFTNTDSLETEIEKLRKVEEAEANVATDSPEKDGVP